MQRVRAAVALFPLKGASENRVRKSGIYRCGPIEISKGQLEMGLYAKDLRCALRQDCQQLFHNQVGEALPVIRKNCCSTSTSVSEMAQSSCVWHGSSDLTARSSSLPPAWKKNRPPN